MKGRVKLAIGVAVVAALAAAGTVAVAGGGDTIRERLSGYQEDPLVLSTSGNGKFTARINDSRQEIDYKLRYGDDAASPAIDVAALSDAELVALQTSSNDWHSRHARRVLQERR